MAILLLLFGLLSFIGCFNLFIFGFLIYLFFSFGSWNGLFLFSDSSVFFFLVYMSLLIFLLVVWWEVCLFLVFLSLFLVLLSLGFFFVSNFFVLFIFFELSLFPIIIMVLGFGNQVEKVGASYYLIFYSFFCSTPFLFLLFTWSDGVGFIYCDSWLCWEFYCVVNLFFLFKFPVYFLHLWLPKAHVEAPTSASMLLAGLLLKLGTGGYIRVLGLVGGHFLFFFFVVVFFGIFFSGVYCVLQSDLKALSAYSSIMHMSFVWVSLIFLGFLGKSGGLLVMVSHGFVSTILFYMVGEFFHISGTRNILFFGGIFLFDFFLLGLMIFTLLSNCGVPPSLSFFGEVFSISMIFSLCFFFWGFLLLYFFISFYYSLFLLVCGIVNRSFWYSLTSAWLLGGVLVAVNINFFMLFVFI